MDTLIDRRELAFQLYDMLNVEQLCTRSAFQDHDRETFESVLDVAEKIARDYLVDHNRLVDEQEPVFDGEKVTMRPEVKDAFDAIAGAGFIAGRELYENGGMQLPESVMSACMAVMSAANVSTVAYPFLTTAAARVIKHFASDDLKQQFLPPMFKGRFTGTMALTEPQAGSSLADIVTKATPSDDGSYRIKGHKVYISAGDHELSDNIIHLVLAKIEGAPAGVKGISLFLVPKFLLDENGEPAERNDVALAGLFHKLGYRGTTSTALNFGEQGNCVGYLIGEPHQGLKYMFQMMNEARIMVGMGATSLGYRGYQHSLEYARTREQGRSPSNSHPDSKPLSIIEHVDVKRMLLAQKAYTEGGLALGLYGCSLVDDINSASSSKREEAQLLLDLLTPILKAWPSEFCLKANDLAIQVLGGAGYTREYPVEQCWRDNRLNPIHEGTNGIQSIDLLGRKVWMQSGQGLKLLHREMTLTMENSPEVFNDWVTQLQSTLAAITEIMMTVGRQLRENPDKALANSHAFLTLMGHTVVAWQWLKQAGIAQAKLAGDCSEQEQAFYRGKVQAAHYFFAWELPTVQRDIAVMKAADQTVFDMQSNWF
ncbi:acyl-CoA dehydrogenase [uncultured Endozoicomonas sp.]|uniref:acyl-CoA dehydrogenase n=1 Tax=uncultured Endozoicomonas sp. TaxID=432652 RepID=UPI00260DD7F2|nr:acyl-CoA dehydrogenase [uncultured Endozoicomonas sp.]